MFNEHLNLFVLSHIICNWYLIDYLLGQLQIMWLSLSINLNLWFRSSLNLCAIKDLSHQGSKIYLSRNPLVLQKFRTFFRSSGYSAEVPNLLRNFRTRCLLSPSSSSIPLHHDSFKTPETEPPVPLPLLHQFLFSPSLSTLKSASPLWISSCGGLGRPAFPFPRVSLKDSKVFTLICPK